MRENRLYGSEGGEGASPSLPLSGHRRGLGQAIGHNAKNIDNRGFSAGSRQRLSLSGMMDHTDMRVRVRPLAV